MQPKPLYPLMIAFNTVKEKYSPAWIFHAKCILNASLKLRLNYRVYIKDENIDNYRYINISILWIYWEYILMIFNNNMSNLKIYLISKLWFFYFNYIKWYKINDDAYTVVIFNNNIYNLKTYFMHIHLI